MRKATKETDHELALSQKTYAVEQSSDGIESQPIHNDQGSDGDVT